MNRALVTVILLWTVTAAPARGGSEKEKAARTHTNPAGLSKPTGYTHTVSVRGGRTLYIAGQVAANAQGEIVGKGDLRAQTRQVYENLRLALAGAGGSFRDIVKLNTYVVGFQPEHLPILREVRAEMFKGITPPASTLVGVVALANPDFLIEIEAIAVVD